MGKKLIPDNIKKEIIKMVDEFNKLELSKVNYFYNVKFKGKFIYLNLNIHNRVEPRGRLEYSGDLDDLSFAIFKYSSESYDSEEVCFPGVGFLDGTVKGGMRAGIKAYRVDFF